MSNTSVQVFTQTYSSTSVLFDESWGFTTINFSVITGTATILGSLAPNGVTSTPITLNKGEYYIITTSTNLILTGITLTCAGDTRVTAIQ
jgi:hypothetical protein